MYRKMYQALALFTTIYKNTPSSVIEKGVLYDYKIVVYFLNLFCTWYSKTKQDGIQIGRVELVDAHSVKVANAYNNTTYKEALTLFLEFHGNEAGLAQDVLFATDITNDFNCLEIEFEQDTAATIEEVHLIFH